MHKLTFYHVGGHVCLEGVPTSDVCRIVESLKRPETLIIHINSLGRGSDSTTIINVRQLTTVSIEPPLPDVGAVP